MSPMEALDGGACDIGVDGELLVPMDIAGLAAVEYGESVVRDAVLGGADTEAVPWSHDNVLVAVPTAQDAKPTLCIVVDLLDGGNC